MSGRDTLGGDDGSPRARGDVGVIDELPIQGVVLAVEVCEVEAAVEGGGDVETGAVESCVDGSLVVAAEHVPGVVVDTGSGVFDLAVADLAGAAQPYPAILHEADGGIGGVSGVTGSVRPRHG